MNTLLFRVAVSISVPSIPLLVRSAFLSMHDQTCVLLHLLPSSISASLTMEGFPRLSLSLLRVFAPMISSSSKFIRHARVNNPLASRTYVNIKVTLVDSDLFEAGKCPAQTHRTLLTLTSSPCSHASLAKRLPTISPVWSVRHHSCQRTHSFRFTTQSGLVLERRPFVFVRGATASLHVVLVVQRPSTLGTGSNEARICAL